MLTATMTLLDAQPYDAARSRRRRTVVATLVAAVLLGAWLTYHFRNYPERTTVNRFFANLQKQDYESAYAVWFHDPDWKQHQEKFSSYPFSDFYRDWGPGGEWGLIKSYAVDCSLSPGGGSGVIVQVTVNSRAQHAYVWVQKSDKTLSFSPSEIECGNWWTWVTE
ncbi:MAG: hypothetical protein ACLPOO_12065 [Terriglobales bacterium]